MTSEHWRNALILVASLAAIAAASAPAAAVDQAFSRQAPTGLDAAKLPQLVSITFDDNFGLLDDKSVGGVPEIVDLYAGRRNPAGSGDAANFDGKPIRATFFNTSVYMVPPSQTVLGGISGRDAGGRNLAAWREAYAAGHEIAVHTVNHFNGGELEFGSDDCCRARNWTGEEWKAEIEGSRSALAGPGGVGAPVTAITGFRAPYLSSNDAMFDALTQSGFRYDSSLSACLADSDDGSNCPWPYTLAGGTPDNRMIRSHPGLWEVPPTGLVVPPDDVAARYGFAAGLRERMAARGVGGKVIGMDFPLLVDVGISGDEMRAILSYNLDLHLEGNRAPLVFVAHAHLYAFSNPQHNPDTPSLAERDARWKGLADFIDYALSKPEVRIVAAGDVVTWMEQAIGGSPPASR